MVEVAVVVNPTKVADLSVAQAALAGMLGRDGFRQVRWLPTTPGETGEKQAREAVRGGARLVLAWGGDGTLREVGRGLVGTGVPMGILPGGTGNLVARNLGIPVSLAASLDIALHGRSSAMDVNRVDLGDGRPRISLQVCGMGLDAAVVASPEALKEKLGVGAYLVSGVRHFRGRAAPVTVQIDEDQPRTVAGRMVLVANIGRMQLGINPFLGADANDGELAVLIARLRGVGDLLRTTTGVLLHRRGRGSDRLQLSGRRVSLRTEEPWPREVDGDPVPGGSFMSVEVLPEALLVRIPSR